MLDLVSPEFPEAIRALHDAVEATCLIFELLKNPQMIVDELKACSYRAEEVQRTLRVSSLPCV
jgi:hypothetical protein